MVSVRLAFIFLGSAAAFSTPAPLRRPAGNIGSALRSPSSSALGATLEETTKENVAGNDASQTLVKSVEEPIDKASPVDVSGKAFEAATPVEIAGGVTVVEEEEGMGSYFLWRGAVAALCALWASNFAAAKLILAEPGIDSATYAVARFSVAALALLPGAVAAVRRGAIDLETARGAAICGSWVAFGYLGQTLGLLTTTASRSCVICSMHCVFVAVVAEWMRVSRLAELGTKANFDTTRLVPAAVAVAGVAIVELQGAAGGPTIGDALSFAQPIGFGLGYLQLEELMRKKPEAALPVSAIKLLVVVFMSFGLFELSPLMNSEVADGLQALWPPRVPDFGPVISSPVALGGILYTGLITTALALWVESIAFKRVPATDASIILTTEPLFAAGAGAILLGETFGLSDYVGASLIIGACILSILIQEEEEDPMCDPYSPEDCVPARKWPFYGE